MESINTKYDGESEHAFNENITENKEETYIKIVEEHGK